MIVGAGAVATGKMTEEGVYGGNPARLICTLQDYYERRKLKQLPEALEVWRRYVARFGREPLLGSGITRFDDGRPSDDELLRCMLCTLRASGMSFKAGIEIVLNEETARSMRLYEIRDYTKFWK